MIRPPRLSSLFPYTTLFRSVDLLALWEMEEDPAMRAAYEEGLNASAKSAAETISLWKKFDNDQDRKSTRLNSSHLVISYAVFCLKKKRIPYLLSRRT